MSTGATTSYDIARRAGVSQSTVSRALRGDLRVAESTRLKIQQIAQEINYVPNIAARNLITGHNSTIGVVVADLLNPVYPQLVESVQQALTERGFRMILLSDSSEGSRESEVDALRGGLVSGIVFMQARTDSTMAQDLASFGLPLVVLGRDVLTDSPALMDRVVTDSVGGGTLAADYLHGLGHRRIGFITGPENNPSSLIRGQVFTERLAELGAPLDPELVAKGSISHASGLELGTRLLSLPNPPTAIFCATDYIAFGLIDAARRLGISIPDQLSVLGYDNLEMASWSMFDLTTVHQPFAEAAKVAVQILLDRVEGVLEGPSERVVFPVSLIERSSTGPVPA